MSHRYNTFLQIHKGLRAMLYDTAIAIQQCDFGDEEATAFVVKRVEQVIWLFEGHAHTEDSKVFPMIQAYAPEVVQDFEQQHVLDHAHGETLQQTLDLVKTAPDEESRKSSATGLCRAFEFFLAFNLEHMVKEETFINPLLWKYYSDAELHALTAKIVQSIPMDMNMLYSHWMIAGINDEELITWLEQARQMAPPIVYDYLWDTACQVLKPERWAKISERLAYRMAA
jgi:hypothetical protein